MPTIRLIRQVDAPDGRGPKNGQYALQRLLRRQGWPWLAIGGDLQPGEVPWVWSCEDAELAIAAAVRGEPFVLGPNVLFGNSRQPRGQASERILCEAASCTLLFTESAWYAELIRANLGRLNRAAIALWSYPIDPVPPGPEPPDHDLLIYAKSGYSPRFLREISRRALRPYVVSYGRYQREEMLQAARRSLVCLYFSDDDRGPLALAEILLSGCPVVGVPRGAPWIEPGVNGFLVEQFFSVGRVCECLDDARRLDREAVRADALTRFDPARTVAAIRAALEPIAAGP